MNSVYKISKAIKRFGLNPEGKEAKIIMVGLKGIKEGISPKDMIYQLQEITQRMIDQIAYQHSKDDR